MRVVVPAGRGTGVGVGVAVGVAAGCATVSVALAGALDDATYNADAAASTGTVGYAAGTATLTWTRVTGTPVAAMTDAVEPVETISTPAACSAAASSVSPVLS